MFILDYPLGAVSFLRKPSAIDKFCRPLRMGSSQLLYRVSGNGSMGFLAVHVASGKQH